MKEYNINAVLPKGDTDTQKSFAVKYPIGNDYGKAFFDMDMRLGTIGRAWYVVGWGYVRESGDFSRIRPLTLSLNSGSEISYDGKIWKYEDFGKLAMEIESIKVENTLEVLG